MYTILGLYLHENLKQKLEKLFLGKPFLDRNETFPQDCFKAEINKTISNYKYLTIIGKDLDFIFNISHQIALWNNAPIKESNFIVTEELNIDDRVSEKPVILAKLRHSGKLIYSHPNN
jgi:hypothetical protein